MSRFNLIDEKWIRVMSDERGTIEEVSLVELFRNAHRYKCLAGETVTQDFVTLRFLLAILLTVYSRFDADGEAYEFVELDDKFRQLNNEVPDGYSTEYADDLIDTWEKLWETKKFGTIVEDYLQKWHDSFYLFDEEKPFAQISLEVLENRKLSKDKPGSVSGKNINRLISESGNKVALFSPKYDKGNNKERLNEAEIARWLLTFHGYVGLSDKVIFGSDKYKASKGWVFDIGGVYLEGETLIETLLLNLTLLHPIESQRGFSQKPLWEKEIDEALDDLMAEKPLDNLAELYTNWSRAIYMNPETDVSKPFSFDIIKVPEVNHQDNFLEVMTVWKDNKTGPWKGSLTPRKHTPEQSIWRSFGLLSLPTTDNHRKPGIVDWLNQLLDLDIEIDSHFKFVSMKDDANATSWVPADEIYDVLNIEEHVMTDVQEDGWVPRINDEVERTKTVVGFILRGFASDINEIRNSKNTGFVSRVVSEAYFEIDMPFRQWLSNIKIKDDKNEKVSEWRKTLRDRVIKEADKLVLNAGNREYIGIEKNDKIFNIATAYNRFIARINKELPKGEAND